MKNVVDIPTAAMRVHRRRERKKKVREWNREALRQLLIEHNGVDVETLYEDLTGDCQARSEDNGED